MELSKKESISRCKDLTETQAVWESRYAEVGHYRVCICGLSCTYTRVTRLIHDAQTQTKSETVWNKRYA